MTRVSVPALAARLLTLFVIAAGVMVAAPEPATAARYHVSYLWHHDVARVRDYRDEVARVLGRTVAHNLKVVAGGNLFGLIYMRRGGSTGAARVARVHSRLLLRAGLDGAAAMREGRWSIVDADQKLARARPVEATYRTGPSAVRRHNGPDLEAAVSQYIKGLRREGLITPDERTGWSVYDFTSGEKLVTINEDVRFQAASLIKPFVATAFFHRVKEGAFVYGRKSRHHMFRMIHYSDNRSTNWVMRQVGGPRAVERILRTHYGAIFQDTRFVEYIPASGKTYRNKASVHDYSRFLFALWKERLPGAREIRRLMSLPGADRIFTGVDDFPEGSKVYNKTGSTARLCGDMGIISVKGPAGKTYPYIIVGLIEKQRHARNYTRWIRSRGQVIRNVSNIIYNGISRYHDLGDAL